MRNSTLSKGQDYQNLTYRTDFMGKAVCWKKVLKFNWQGLELVEEGGWQ